MDTDEAQARLCAADGCDRALQCKGYCDMHYKRVTRHGDPAGYAPRSSLAPPPQRFVAHVSVTSTGCHEWTGALRDGYGQFSVDARLITAHRFSYEMHCGPIPDGLHIDHLCHNRRCVNPDHLEAVTQAENNRRAAAAKTCCKHGHAYDQTNTRYTSKGHRYCRECNRLKAARRRLARERQVLYA